MTNKLVVTALGAMIAAGISSQVVASTPPVNKPPSHKKLPSGYEKCYGIAKAGMNDCASSTETCGGQSTEDNAKNAWLGLPKGTCAKILGGRTTEGTA